MLSLDPDIDKASFTSMSPAALVDKFRTKVMDIYEQKKDHFKTLLMPVIKNVYENQGHQYKRILLPIEDGTGHPLQLTADLKGQWNRLAKPLL